MFITWAEVADRGTVWEIMRRLLLMTLVNIIHNINLFYIAQRVRKKKYKTIFGLNLCHRICSTLVI